METVGISCFTKLIASEIFIDHQRSHPNRLEMQVSNLRRNVTRNRKFHVDCG